MFSTWRRTEPVKQAPPITIPMLHGFAGSFIEQGYPQTAVMVLVAHHCILRRSEFFNLRTTDGTMSGNCILLLLRDTKIGQRVGVDQEVVVKDKWLVPRLKRVILDTPRGELLLGVTPVKFRKCWAVARKKLLLLG